MLETMYIAKKKNMYDIILYDHLKLDKVSFCNRGRGGGDINIPIASIASRA